MGCSVIKPSAFRVLDEGKDVEELYDAVYWWIDGDGRVWIRVKDTNAIHEVFGKQIEIKICEKRTI